MPATVATTTVEPTATMKPAASTVESSTAVEPASTMKATTAMKPAAELAATCKRSPSKAFVSKSPPKIVTVETAAEASVKPTTSKESGAEERPSVKAMEPRACADKHTIHEPFRAVVTVRCACVRVIIIIAVST
jgi:hypothetical protein